MQITNPQHPMTTSNTDGYTEDELARLNALFVEAFNHVAADIDPEDDFMIFQTEQSIWNAIGQTDGNLTLVLDRFR